jgi:hypothetical protein
LRRPAAAEVLVEGVVPAAAQEPVVSACASEPIVPVVAVEAVETG